MPPPPHTPRIPLCEVSPNSRSRVVSARDYGAPWIAISEQENLPYSTCRTIFRNAPNQASCKSRPRNGRPPVITPRDGRALFRAIANNPKITAAKLRAEVLPTVSKITIYRYLKKSGIQKWRCKKRPFLDDERAAARLHWAYLHDNQPPAYWKRWPWSDECSIERGKGGKWDFVYRMRGKYIGLPLKLNYSRIFTGEGLLPWAVQGEGTRGQTTMFWAAFGHGKRTPLVAMKGDPAAPRGGVTARRYIEVIEEYLLPALENDTLFMQDNSQVHRAILVQDWFAEREIDVLDWPPYSPDMNPIENLWKLLKAKIIELYPELEYINDNDTTKAHLIAAAKEAWLLLEEELLNKLALGMQKRIDALKAAQVWYTKY